MPETSCARDPLLDAITAFLAHKHVSELPGVRASLERAIDEAGPGAVVTLGRRLARAGSDWSYYPRDPLARRIHHLLAGRVLRDAPVLFGGEHLAAVAGQPVVIFANHLSYSDANVVDVLSIGGLQDRLTVVAGPKVYSDVRRRFSSLCFGTIKTPQSGARSSEEAIMSPRELVRAARQSIETAEARLRLGEALLVFPEGSRSRSGQLQPLLPGVARYLKGTAAWVLPIGITGTEKLFPIGEHSLNAVPIAVRAGRPIPATVLSARTQGDRRLTMDVVGFAIAALLPAEYRGVYSDVTAETAAARALSEELFGA